MNPSKNNPRGVVEPDETNLDDFDSLKNLEPRDIYLGGGAPKRKKRIGVIILVLIAFVLALICGALMLSGNAHAEEEETIRDETSTSDETDASEEEVAEEEGTPKEEVDTSINCLNSSGAKSLGWALCPILDLLGDATSTVYNHFVKPSLQINPILFASPKDKNDAGAISGWETFRNIANILFIVLFLVVVFSQLTGVGIDNYGIKKILPRMIVAAILINLSYWICLALVDLSNILGGGFQAMFNQLGADLKAPQLEIYGSNASLQKEEVLGGLTVVVVLGAIVKSAGAFWANPAILLSVFVSALSVAIAVFFLFILLTVREAAIIVLVVLAPIAIASYMLPNIKLLFDKWRKFFTALLLVYPICGLLVGGGNYVSNLLLSSRMSEEGFMEAFTAMIVGIVPIFLIPTVLKGSFAAMGNLGAKLTTMGQRAGSFTSGKIRGSQAYGNLQQIGAKRRSRIGAGLNRGGKETRFSRGVGRVMNFGRGGKRTMAQERIKYLQDQDAAQRAESLMGVGYDAARIAQEKKVESDTVANWEVVVDSKSRNGSDYDALSELYDEYSRGGNTDGMRAVVRVAGRRKDLAMRFMDEKVKREGAVNIYGQNAMASVAKEIATGSSSATYRAASPLGYSFASQINERADRTGAEGANYNYSGERGWKNSENMSIAAKAFVTNSSELVGVSGRELDEIREAISQGNMSEVEANRLVGLARQTYENRNDPSQPYDTTKDTNIQQLAYTSYRGGQRPPVGGGPVRARGGGNGLVLGNEMDVREEIARQRRDGPRR